MKKGLQTFYAIAYLILSVLVLLMIVGAVVAVVQGDAEALTGGLAFVVFALFAALQVICLSVYKPGLTLYKIGFYLLHGGLLLMLVGFLAYALAGEQLNVDVPVNSAGSFYSSVQNEEGEMTSLGFGLRIDKFRVEKYEDTGNDKYYRADLTFVDTATLQQESGYLEVNRTMRNNGWKIYLMSYTDGSAILRSTYGLTEDRFYGTYSADGAASGVDLVSLVQQDLGGYFYSYYFYNDAALRFAPISEETLATQPGTLYAHTFAQGNQVNVYVSRTLNAFDASVTPDNSFTADGGSELTASLVGAYGEPNEGVRYQLYDRTTGGYVQASQSDIQSQSGYLKGYALAMGDELVVYVHPVSVMLLIKKDPGEFVVLAGMALLFVGTVLTCLIRGRKKDSADGADEPAAPKRSAKQIARKGATK